MADKDNRLNGASRLSLPANRNDKLGSTDLDDLFRVSLGAKSKLDLGLSKVSKGANFDVEVYKFKLPVAQVLKKIGKVEFRKLKSSDRNKNLQLLGASRSRGNKNEKINLASLEAGDYLIRVLQRQGSSKYRLSATATLITDGGGNNGGGNNGGGNNGGGGTTDPDGSAAGALSKNIPDAAIAGGLGGTDSQDFYKVTPTIAGDYLFDLSGFTSDVNLEVRSSNGTTVLRTGNNTGTKNEKFIQPLAAGSTYYFRVFQASGTASTNYNLSVSALSDNYGGKYASGLASATSLTLSSTKQTLSNYVVDQGVNSPEDFFKFDVTTAQAFLTLELTNMPIGNLGVQIFKSTETPDQGLTVNKGRNPDGSYPSEVFGGRLTQGTYYIRVLPGGSSEGSTYNLALSLTDKSGVPAISRDVKFGADGSTPRNITSVGSFAYFSASDEDGTALWRTDGTLDGTKKIRAFSSLEKFVAVGTGANARLYFVANDGSTGKEVWTTDGVNATKVVDLYSGVGGSLPEQLTAVGNRLYFVATPGDTGKALYRVDGTAVTQIARDSTAIKNPDGTASTAPIIGDFSSLTGYGNTLYFAGSKDIQVGPNTITSGSELFRIVGDNAPELTDLKPGSGSSSPSNFVEIGGQLFVTATVGGSFSKQLVRIDQFGAAPSFSVVRSSPTNNLTFSNQPLQYTVTDDGTLYFAATSSNEGTELFRLSNPATATASGGFIDAGPVVLDIISGTDASNPTNLTHIGNTVYFFASNTTVDGGGNTIGNGREVWRSNGTAQGTTILADIQGDTGNGIGDNAEMIVFNNTLYFTANDGSQGTELWSSNGNVGNAQATIINTIPSQGANPSQLTQVGTSLFFAANDGFNGEELWSV